MHDRQSYGLHGDRAEERSLSAQQAPQLPVRLTHRKKFDRNIEIVEGVGWGSEKERERERFEGKDKQS